MKWKGNISTLPQKGLLKYKIWIRQVSVLHLSFLFLSRCSFTLAALRNADWFLSQIKHFNNCLIIKLTLTLIVTSCVVMNSIHLISKITRAITIFHSSLSYVQLFSLLLSRLHRNIPLRSGCLSYAQLICLYVIPPVSPTLTLPYFIPSSRNASLGFTWENNITTCKCTHGRSQKLNCARFASL